MTETTPDLPVGQDQRDLLEQLLKPEIQASLTQLVDQLPKLTEVVNMLTKCYDFARLVATDETLRGDTVGAIQELASPVVDMAKHTAQSAIEAKERAEASHETIGMFGLMRMLKEPQMQKVLRFARSYMQVCEEQKKRQGM